jgi:hypothetical protein
MSATWSKERSTAETIEIMKPPHTGLNHDADISFMLTNHEWSNFYLMSWCLSWRSRCAAALWLLSETSLAELGKDDSQEHSDYKLIALSLKQHDKRILEGYKMNSRLKWIFYRCRPYTWNSRHLTCINWKMWHHSKKTHTYNMLVKFNTKNQYNDVYLLRLCTSGLTYLLQ